MRLPAFVVKSHRWLGLLLGLQVILWLSGGFVMSALPLGQVRGEDRVREAAARTYDVDEPLLAPTEAAARLGVRGFSDARLDRRLGRPVWQLDTADGPLVVDAATGERLPPLAAEQARAVAVADYAGAAAVAAVTLQTEPSLEIRGREPPLWRVDFADGRRTTVYVDPLTGAVAARRNTLWRVYDVFWMLHIMDYRTRDDFNHPLLVGSAAAAWFLAASGAWLVVLWLRRRARRR